MPRLTQFQPLALILALCAALPLSAQEIPEDRLHVLGAVYDGDNFGRCVYRGEDPNDCIGHFRRSCQKNAQNAVENRYCIDAELKSWDFTLNWLYDNAMKAVQEFDAAEGTVEGKSPLSRAAHFREMQRAWIPYRDALCGFAASFIVPDPAASDDLAVCLSDETARQAILLMGVADIE